MKDIINFYNNGFYYPNQFLGVILVTFTVFLLVVFLIFKRLIPYILYTHKCLSGGGFYETCQYSNTRKGLKTSFKYLYLFLKLTSVFIKYASRMFSICDNRFRFLLEKRTIEFFSLLVFIVFFSRFTLSYTSSSHSVTPPERLFTFKEIGADLYTGVGAQAIKMMNGQTFNYPSAYGPASLLFVGLSYKVMDS